MDTTSSDQPLSEPIDAVIGTIAAGQHGVVSRAQVLQAGATAAQIAHRVEVGRWRVLLRGVYRLSGAPQTRLGEMMAAVLWAGPGALLSHRAAGELWGFEGVRATKAELWVPAPRAPRSSRVIVHRGIRLDRADRARRDAIAVTSPARTLVDLSGVLETDALEVALESALRARLATAARVRARLHSLGGPGRRGSQRLGDLLDRRGDGAALESALEARFWSLLVHGGLPQPQRQHWVVVNGRRYRLDFAWPDRRVAVECDGWSAHGGNRAFRLDRARLADLASTGWTVVPITWDACVKRPRTVLDWVRSALQSAA